LTEREVEVLSAYARHGTQRPIATDLGIKVQTVKNLLFSAYTKLGVTGAIHAFHAMGWLRLPGEGGMDLWQVRLDAEVIRDRADHLIRTLEGEP
jgi:DNA-binding CsgD family transcriptional regulator